MSANAIEINHLSKFYGKQRGIEDVDFSVHEGEIFGFIGPNGAGKSTTIRTLLALIHPSSGNATIFGKDCIREAPVIAQNVGYLPSETFFYENMKAKDLFKYAEALYKKDCSRRIAELTSRLNLDVNRKIRDLSFGNKKKVGIVAGLLHSPRLLILDEPTSGLDPLMQQTFFEILREENDKGVTILFSSHILSEVQKMCHRIAILKEGRVVSLENIDAMRSDAYKKISLSMTAATDERILEMQGITSYEQNGTEVNFLFKGDINELLTNLRNRQLTDLLVEEPSLEEIFMHYYA